MAATGFYMAAHRGGVYPTTPWFTTKSEMNPTCNCNDELLHFHFVNPFFGSKNNVKTKKQMIEALSKIPKFESVLENNACVEYLYNISSQDKNRQNLSIVYCRSCQVGYEYFSKVSYKWCNITYRTSLDVKPIYNY